MPTREIPCKHEGNNVLLVEGIDDCHVIMSLCAAQQVPETFGLYECGGDKPLLSRLNALIVQPDAPRVIGIVLDADTGASNRWNAIRVKLRHYNYRFSDLPESEGTIIEAEEPLPKLGIWLMPNNQLRGMLEDFCIEMIEAKAREIAERAVLDAQNEGVSTFQTVHLSKAIVHTYLAWQDEPGRPLGQAITTQSTETVYSNCLRIYNVANCTLCGITSLDRRPRSEFLIVLISTVWSLSTRLLAVSRATTPALTTSTTLH
jgi:uncharacterized protein DUF3226